MPRTWWRLNIKITFFSYLGPYPTNIAYEGYGGERIYANLVDELAKRGHEVTLIASEGSMTPLNGCLIVKSSMNGKQLDGKQELNNVMSPEVIQAMECADVVHDASNFRFAARWADANKKPFLQHLIGVDCWNIRVPKNIVAISRNHRQHIIHNSFGYQQMPFPPYVSNVRGINAKDARVVYPDIDLDRWQPVYDKGEYYCFPKGTYVYGQDAVPIECVKPNMRVINQHGNYSRVKALLERDYEGDMIRIQPEHGFDILVTPEHPFLVYNTYRTNNPQKPLQRQIVWKRAKDISKDDYLIFKRAHKKRVNKSKLFIKRYSEFKGLKREGNEFYVTNNKRVPSSVDITPDLCRIFGYYVAEGSTSKNETAITFSFNNNEVDYINDVNIVLRNHFQVKAGHVSRTSENGCNVTFHSKILAHLFSNLCGKGSVNKKLPRFFMSLNDNQLSEMLKGYANGDGHYENGEVETVTSVSLKLIHQLRMAYAKLGILTSLQHIVYPLKGKHHIAYTLWFLRGKSGKIGYVKNRASSWYVKVSEVKREYYNGKVYNLECSKTPSYLVHGFIVHNCWFSRCTPDKGLDDVITLARCTGKPFKLFGSHTQGDHYEFFHTSREDHKTPYEQLIRETSNIEWCEDAVANRARQMDIVGHAKAFVFPVGLRTSYAEAFGLVLLEAMALGTPVITSSYGSASEIVKQGKTGFVCSAIGKDPNDPHYLDNFVEAMDNVGKINPVDCRREAEKYRKGTQADAFEKLYKEVIEGRSW